MKQTLIRGAIGFAIPMVILLACMALTALLCWLAQYLPWQFVATLGIAVVSSITAMLVGAILQPGGQPSTG